MSQQSTFDIWLNKHMPKRSGGSDTPARVVVVLGLLERLRKQPTLVAGDHLTDNQQQLLDHNRHVSLALKRFQLTSPVDEFGRRASNVRAWISSLFQWLRERNFETLGPADREAILDKIGAITASRVRTINEAKPLVARCGKGTARAVVADLLNQAQQKNRAKDVAEYLVGAKLQILYGDAKVSPKNVNTPSQHGDFVVGRTVIEVTVNPADTRHLTQMIRVLKDTGFNFWLVVRQQDRDKWQTVVDATFHESDAERVVVLDIETLVCINVAEAGEFDLDGEHDNLKRLFDQYNLRWLPSAGGGALRIVMSEE